MSKSDYLTKYLEFEPLWARAKEKIQMLSSATSLGAAMHFDSHGILTVEYFSFIRSLLQLKGVTQFAVVSLKPDPFNYFHYHFNKYPAIIFRPEHDVRDFVDSLNADPGGSPADAISNNSEQYVLLPLPGDWIIYADLKQELAVMSGPADVVHFARKHYPFNVFESNPGFTILAKK